MRLLAPLLAIALLAAPLQAQPAPFPADDARGAIAAVLAHQATMRGAESAALICVVSALAPPPVAAGEEDPMLPDHAVRIYFQWHVPEPAAVVRPPPLRPDGQRRRSRNRPPPVPLPAPVAAELAQRLDGLRGQAARNAAGQEPAIGEIDADLVAPPMRLQEMGHDCAPLQLSAPAFAGETAFVATSYACGTTCGNGSLYALERRAGRWEVVAVADIWIS